MGITPPKPPTFAEIEQQREELLAQGDFPSRHPISAADPDPALPPITALPISEPRSPPPQHSLRSVFDQYALYFLDGEAVHTLAPHTEAQPEAILLQLLAAFGNIVAPALTAWSAPPDTP